MSHCGLTFIFSGYFVAVAALGFMFIVARIDNLEKMTLFSLSKTISTPWTNFGSNKAPHSHVSILTLFTGLILIYSPSLDVKKFVFEGYWRGWPTKNICTIGRVGRVMWWSRLFSHHPFLCVRDANRWSTSGGIVNKGRVAATVRRIEFGARYRCYLGLRIVPTTKRRI